MPGPFFTLDGLDGTGKSTQCRLLADVLRGRGFDVVTCVDPGGTPIGQQLRELLLKSEHPLDMTCEALLFMASRAQLVSDVIRPALAAGKAVVSDRFLLANVVYQGHAGGLDVEQLWRIGDFAAGGLVPDLVLVLDLPIDVARQRRDRAEDRMERRPTDFHERVRAGFRHEAARCPERIRVIDARPGVDEVQAAIRREVAPLVGP